MEPIVQLNSNAKLSEHLASPSEATLGHSNKLDGSHLSPHFTLGEMTKSNSHPEVYNIPSHEAIANLKRVCGWLEVLRKRYNERYNACHLDNHPSVMSSGVETSHEISPRAALGRDDKGGGTLDMTTAPVSSRLSEAHGEISEKPIIINSGYRSPQLNKKIGGVAGSKFLLIKKWRKVWNFVTFFIPLQANIERKYGQDKDKRDAAQECGAAVEAD
jgi:hypothetical protein